MLLTLVLTYLLVDVFCLFFTVFLFFKITVDVGTSREVNALRGLLIIFSIYLVFDATWALGVYGAVPMTDAAVGIIESVSVLLMCGVAYCWFIFAENKMHAPFMRRRRSALVAAIPFLIIVIMYATTRFTGLIYLIGPNSSFSSGSAVLTPMFVFLFYAAFTAVHAIVMYFRESSRALRREYLTLAAFVFAPTACGIIDMVVHGTPIMALSVIASTMLVLINIQNSRINTDVLTGLNNRRRAEEYIEDQVSSLAKDKRFALYLVDVDFFKDINDTYGHGEGDHALEIIAKGLRLAVGRRRGLAARWGGDEFIVATYLESNEPLESFESTIRLRVEEVREREQPEFNISLSIGYTIARRHESLPDLLAQADVTLYDQKKARHAAISQNT